MKRTEIITKIKKVKPTYFEANSFFGQKMEDFKKIDDIDFLYAPSYFNREFMGYSYCGFDSSGEFLSGGISKDEINTDNNIIEIIKERIK